MMLENKPKSRNTRMEARQGEPSGHELIAQFRQSFQFTTEALFVSS